MKKCISMLAAVMMLTSVTVPAFAEEFTEEYAENGLNVTYTEDFADTKGFFMPYPYGEIGSGLFYMPYFYFAMPEEDLQTLMYASEDELTEEDIDRMTNAQGVLQIVVAIDGGRTADDIAEDINPDGDRAITELASVGEYNFYRMDLSEEETAAYLAGLDPEYVEEYGKLHDELTDALDAAEYYEPVIPGAGLIGQTMSFVTEDIDGKEVKSEDIFAEHEITMVNLWATWCGPCKGELAELAEMNRALADKDCAVIGMVHDGRQEGKLEVCKELLAENGVDYLNILPPEDDLLTKLDIQGFPSSYFVGRDGKILTVPFTGAPATMSDYEEVIDALLAGKEAQVDKAPSVAENGEGTYRVIVTDEDGQTVEGVMVQFCSDTTCMLAETDADGIASYDVEEGEYTVHIIEVPDDYEMTNEEFPTLDTYCDVCITLQKAE